MDNNAATEIDEQVTPDVPEQAEAVNVSNAESNLIDYDANLDRVGKEYANMELPSYKSGSFSEEFARQMAHGTDLFSALASSVGAAFDMQWWKDRRQGALLEEAARAKQNIDTIVGGRNAARAKFAQDAANISISNANKATAESNLRTLPLREDVTKAQNQLALERSNEELDKLHREQVAKFGFNCSVEKSVAEVLDNRIAAIIPDQKAKEYIMGTRLAKDMHTICRSAQILEYASKGNKYAIQAVQEELVPTLERNGFTVINNGNGKYSVRRGDGAKIDVNRENLLKISQAIEGEAQKQANAYTELHSPGGSLINFYFNDVCQQAENKEWAGKRAPADVYQILQRAMEGNKTPQWRESVARTLITTALDKLADYENITDYERKGIVANMQTLLPVLGIRIKNEKVQDLSKLEFIMPEGNTCIGLRKLSADLKAIEEKKVFSFSKEVRRLIDEDKANLAAKAAEAARTALKNDIDIQQDRANVEKTKAEAEKIKSEFAVGGLLNGGYDKNGYGTIDVQTGQGTIRLKTYDTSREDLSTEPGNGSYGIVVTDKNFPIDPESPNGNLYKDKNGTVKLTNTAFTFNNEFLPSVTGKPIAVCAKIPVVLSQSVKTIRASQKVKEDSHFPGGLDLVTEFTQNEISTGVRNEKGNIQKEIGYKGDFTKGEGVWMLLKEAQDNFREYVSCLKRMEKYNNEALGREDFYLLRLLKIPEQKMESGSEWDLIEKNTGKGDVNRNKKIRDEYKQEYINCVNRYKSLVESSLGMEKLLGKNGGK